MNNTLTRFGNLKYEHFKIKFLNLDWEIKLLDDCTTFPNSDNKNLCEEFKIIVTNGDKTISYKFYNSSMEKQISDILKQHNKNLSWGLIKSSLKTNLLRMWGGYDKDLKNNKTLEYARIKHLFYSVLNCFAQDMTTDLSSFSWFCSNFGYHEDSRKAEKIFNECVTMQDKIKSLNLNKEQIKYLEDEAQQETNDFKEDVYNTIEQTKTTLI